MSVIGLVEKMLISKNGTEHCKEMASVPTNEMYFATLRDNVEKNFAKYENELTVEEYADFLDEVFEIHKEYKLAIDNASEKEYSQTYLDYAKKLVAVKHKYNLKDK